MKKNKYDQGLEELLCLLISDPEIVKELIFEPNNCKRLLATLKGRTARRMLGQHGKQVENFLDYIAGDQDGYPIAQCFGGTQYLCAKGTGVGLQCGGGTKPPPPGRT